MTIASVTAVSAAVVSPSIAANIPSSANIGEYAESPVGEGQAEDPRILELGAKIDPLLQAYKSWTAREPEAYAIFQRLCPPVPDDLVTAHEKYPSLRDCRVEEQDCRGFPEPTTYIGSDGKRYATPPRRILDSKLLRIRIIKFDVGRTSKIGRETRRLARLAMSYERAKQDAISESDYANIENERRWAAGNLLNLAYDLRKLEPKTPLEIAIYARALVAFEEAESCAGRITGGSAQLLGSKIAAAILQLGSEQGRLAEAPSVATAGGAA
jgi:hypothetical protein